MSHETLRERILDLAYGELDPREAGRVEEHARSCAVCGAELARIREARRLVAALPVEPAPERGERILLAAAREAAERRKARGRPPRWLLGLSVAAASLVAVGAISWRIAAVRPGKGDETALLGRGLPESAPPESRPVAPAEERVVPAQEALARAGGRVEGKEAERAAKSADRFASAAPEEPPRAAPSPAAGIAEAAGPVAAEAPVGGAPRTASLSAAPPASAPREEAAAEAVAEAVPTRKAATRERGAPAPAEGAADARARWEALRAAGALRREVRAFPGCAGEARREVEVDAAGRVVRYVREGTIAGRLVRVEHVFGEDGALAVVEVRDLERPDAPVDGAALGASLPRREGDARPDAPPRCDR